MKRNLLLLAALSVLFVFAGCKTEVSTEVKLSQLMDEKSYSQKANLYLEIPACSSHQDSRQPSNSLSEAAELVPQVFSNAELVDCFSQNFDSYAHFEIPIHILVQGEQTPEQARNLQILKGGNQILGVQLPEGTKERMDRVRRQSMGTTDMDLSFQIVVENDLNEALGFGAVAVYLDSSPVIFGEFTLSSGESMTVMPSDVSVDQALLGNPVALLLKTN